MVDILSDQQREAEQFVLQGIDLYDEAQSADAHQKFKKAYSLDPEGPKVCAWYGLTLGVVENKVQKGLDMCKKAINSGIPDAMFYRNIGILYVMANNKRLAVAAYQKGMSIDKGNRKIYNEWKKLGIRRKPFFKSLDRSNFLNKFIGKLTYNFSKKRN